MRGRFLVVFIVMAFLCTMVGSTVAATATQDITYQGVLTDTSGNPLTGIYEMTFQLYDESGTTLASDFRSMWVNEGHFTTPISFDPFFFDGRALWLGISVGTDPEMIPRQELRPVPYAMTLRPGAVIKDSTANYLMFVENTGTGPAIMGQSWDGEGVFGRGKWGGTFKTNGEGTDTDPRIGVNVSTEFAYNPGIIVSTSGLFSSGIRVSTSGIGSNGIYSATAGETSYGMGATTSGRYSDAIRASTTADDSTGIYIHTYGSRSPGISATTSSSNSPAVSGESAQDTGVSGKGNVGGYFTTNQAGTEEERRIGVNVSTVYTYNPGVTVSTEGDNSHGILSSTSGSGSVGMGSYTVGDSSDGVSSTTIGDYSDGVISWTHGEYSKGVDVVTSGSNSDGVSVSTAGSSSDGVYVETYGDFTTGVIAETNGYSTTGVYAHTEGTSSPGLHALTEGDGSYGVLAETFGNSTPGVNVVTFGNDSAGVAAATNSANSDGVYTVTLGNDSDGMEVVTNGIYSEGVHATTLGDYSDGVSAATYGVGSRGLVGYSNKSEGVYGVAYGAAGVHGLSTNKAGVWGVSDYDVGVLGESTYGEYGVFTYDKMYAAAGYVGPHADVAEYLPVAEEVTAGTVMIIGPDGTLGPSPRAYDTRVAGIVSTAPGVSLGAKDTGNPGEAQIAVAGRVPCKVDATYGAIHPCDVLTTSPTPGYAMKAVPVMVDGIELYRPSMILGKALGTLESGTGTIEVLVTLQ